VRGPYPATTDHAIVVRDLVKRFGRRNAVNHIDFEVAPGEIFALLGRNGAGKSTTMKMLSTLMRPSAGRALVAGYDIEREPREVRHQIGLVFQENTLDPQLTVEENLRCHATLYGIPRAHISGRIEWALHLLGLTPHRKAMVAALSGGLARRLEIVRALLHKPQILFLDEPSLGLDPPSRSTLWKVVRHLRATEGLTVLMTTHYMDEVENADRLAIINTGEVVAIDAPARLKAAVGLDRVRLFTANNVAALQRLGAAGVSAWADNTGGEDAVVAHLPNAERDVTRLLSIVDLPVLSVTVQRPTLDDVFLHFTEQAMARELTAAPSDRPRHRVRS
jgi:ABC-2 type transport system ATP-binding protein